MSILSGKRIIIDYEYTPTIVTIIDRIDDTEYLLCRRIQYYDVVYAIRDSMAYVTHMKTLTDSGFEIYDSESEALEVLKDKRAKYLANMKELKDRLANEEKARNEKEINRKPWWGRLW